MSTSEPEAQKFGEDPKPFYLAFLILAILELIRRVYLGYVPADFTAYLHAADVFVDGLNPYTWDRETSPRYDGFPYNYVPGTLYLISPLAFLPTAVALGIDWVVRCVCVFYIAKTFHRIVVPNIHFHWVLGLLILWEPLGVDLLFGNLVTYLFCGFTVCVDVADRFRRQEPSHKAGYVALFVCGVLAAFKPYWGIPYGYALLAQRHVRGLIALGAGVVFVVLLTLLKWEFVESLRVHTEAMVSFYQAIDFYSLAPWSIIPITIAGVSTGLYFLKRGPQEWIWLLGCVSIPMWLRTASYSYAIMFPVMLWFIRRWGMVRGVLFSLTMLGPLPWVLRTLPYLKGEQEELWVHLLYTLLVIPILITTLVRSDETNDAET